jgi:hypothetical protein
MRDNYRGGGRQERQVRVASGGSLWPETNKTSPRSPDAKGSIELTGEELTYIINEMNNGADVVKLELASWKKLTHDNRPFSSLSIQTPWAYRQEQQESSGWGGDRRDDRRNDRRDDRRDERQPERRQERRRDDEADERNQYRERSGRGSYPSKNRRQEMSDDEFAKGDRMPDFKGGDDDDLEPPW